MPTYQERAVDDLFGEDLFFKDDEIQLAASGDYATVAGYDALRQAMLVRLITAPGEYAVQPDFGVGVSNFVKRRIAQSDMDTLRQRCIDQLSQDARIEKVEEVLIERFDVSDRTGIKLAIRVRAIGRENAFNFEFFAE
jgi:phage baseplate assembly protein W